MNPDDRYVLNVNPDEQDVVHRNPGESCNLDDAKGRLNIDADTADALLSMGDARACEHCNPNWISVNEAPA